MEQVALRDKQSSRLVRFFLDGEGRVAVHTVHLALGGILVKLEDEDGGCSVLEPGPDGRSLNVFKPGQVVHVDVVTQQQQQPQASYVQPLTLMRPYLSKVVVDVDGMIPLDAEYMSEMDTRLHVTTRVYTWEEVKFGKWSKREVEPQTGLVGYPPPFFSLGSPDEVDWDEVYWDAEHQQHMREIQSWLGLPPDTRFDWLAQEVIKVGAKRLFDNDTAVRSRDNEVLADVAGGVESAVLGVTIYKRFTWPGIYRAHVEYILWGVVSRLPFVQLLTDMKTGGLFYACNGEEKNDSIIWIVVMKDMEELKEAFHHFGKNLPKSAKDFSQEERIQIKTLPRRAKFPHTGATHPVVGALY